MKSFPSHQQLYTLAIIALITLNLPSLHARPIVGRTDTFADGTTQGWGGSYPGYTPHPITVSTGGPAGPNDSYLQISTDGFHLATRNQNRAWTGDYLSVGVKAITMDLKQLTGTNNIRLRLALLGPGGMFTTTERTPSLLAQDDWTTHIFSLQAADLVHVSGGTGILTDTLQTVTKILIRHDSSVPSPPGTHPPHVRAAVGIDNISAVLRDYDAGWTFGNRSVA
ncbi:MAG: hypothetical protein MI892_09125, partial [Desulfobacterales bacterium]|nr:hypothetical protein [Desulfobacterales bacterium]